MAYFILRVGVIIYESILNLCQCRANSKLWNSLQNAKTYQEYVEIAKELDTINRRNEWKFKKDSYCYDIQLVEQKLDELKKYQV